MMRLINTIFGIPLGYLMYICYRLVGNYGISIILFTLITKVIMFPLSLISQKNSIIMIRMRPKLDEIRQRYAGNSSEMAAKQKELYRSERYSAWKGILPLLVQIPIVLGLINVIYNPLQHLMRLDSSVIAPLLERTALLNKTTVVGLGTSAELTVLEAVQSNASYFSGMAGIKEIVAMDLSFLGLSMAEVPTIASISILYPILSGLSALLLAVYQNKHNVLQRSQGAVSRWVTTAILVAFSAFFAAILPCGIGLYWITGNLLSIPVLRFCNLIYDPGEYVQNIAYLETPKLSKEERQEARALKKEKRRRQRVDVKRFNSTKGKRLVFYSESSGFYKYFEGYINYILQHSDVNIHYVTSDIHDRVFSLNNPRIQTYYVGPIALIRVMMLMDADIVVMTMPDLEKYHIKRSLVRKDIEYIYTDHGMTSLHLMLQENALDYFDTIFCYGPNHIREVREMERVYDLSAKTLVKTGYPLLDSMIQGAEAISDTVNDPKIILIAPSWQQDNILEYCLEDTLRPLLGAGYHLIVRPHPEFIKRFPGKMRKIINDYKDDMGDCFEIQTSFASSETVYSADLVITDWSSIANEFSYATKKPSLFINTPMKVVNPNYEKIQLVPLDISLRDEIGLSVNVEDLDTLPDVVGRLLNEADQYREHISEVVRQNIFDVGEGARGGGQYIVDALEGRSNKTAVVPSYDNLVSRWQRVLENGCVSEMEKILNEPLSVDTSTPMTKREFMLDILEELEHVTKQGPCDEA
ncbi:MAG TPA: membrane protein insertase YidC [Clostridiaceae bacterium]|nr:membrane protein insertase YidC [Clostridiaceae bacterium]